MALHTNAQAPKSWPKVLPRIHLDPHNDAFWDIAYIYNSCRSCDRRMKAKLGDDLADGLCHRCISAEKRRVIADIAEHRRRRKVK